MNFDLLRENSLLIVPNNLKNKLLLQMSNESLLLNIKFMTREEFINKHTFEYDEKAVLYLMDNYDKDANVSKVLLENMRYVEHDHYHNAKLNSLFALKRELLDKDVITTDPLFNRFLENKKIYVYGYLYIDRLFKKYLTEHDYQIMEMPNYAYENKLVYRASTLEEEVDFVFNKIGDLLNSGISINNIKIANYSERYNNVFHKLAHFYDMPIEDRGYSIYSTDIVREYLAILSDTQDFSLAFSKVKEKYVDDELGAKIIAILLNVSNKYNGLNYSFNNVFALVKNDLQKSNIITCEDRDKISFIDVNPLLCDENDYVFLIGFNQNELPKLHRDEDYISDGEKEEVALEDTAIKNIVERDEVLNFINNVKHLTISYPLKHLSNEYYPSNLINEYAFEEQDISLSNNNYSKEYAYVKLTKYLDDFIKYGTISSQLGKYYYNYKIDYLTYDNRFTGITKEQLLKKLNHHLLLSYSSINTYNKCHFRYYLDKILKLDKFEETFPQLVGNLFHHLLSICFNDDFDLETEWNKYLETIKLSEKDEIFLIKLKEELRLIIEFVKKLHHETYLTDKLMEYEIYLSKDRHDCPDIKIQFKGIVDKCMYREKDNSTLISIIDYKTGAVDTSLSNVAYGINMQLPIYWYLIKKGNIFDNPKFVGFYLERILNGELKRDDKKSYQEMKMNKLKLVGYSTDDKSRLELFDPTYEKSEFISSMSVKKDGEFSVNALKKTIADDVLDALVDYVDKVIEEDITAILNGDFSINPKQIGKDLIGCDFCQYKDICYRKNEDIKKVRAFEDLSFLGGDDNA